MSLTKKLFNQFMAQYMNYFFLRWLSNTIFIMCIWSVRFPTVLRKLYAEDGKLYWQETFLFPFPQEFLRTDSIGYVTIIMRIGGRFLRLFPIDFAPFFAALFTAICIGYLSAVILDIVKQFIHSRYLQLICSVFFMFVPIASFASIGNFANVYVFWMTAAAIVLISGENSAVHKRNNSLILLIAPLSLPLCIFLLPLIASRLRIVSCKLWQLRFSDQVFIASNLFQILLIAFFSLGERTPSIPSSPMRSLYLISDRVFGSSLMPGWGFVAGSQQLPKYENTIYPEFLYIRFVIAIIVCLGLLYLINRVITNINRFEVAPVFMLFAVTMIYAFTVALLFSPEPRYFVFPGFVVGFIFLWCIDRLQSKIKIVMALWLVLVIVFGAHPSEHLSQGPSWSANLKDAREVCLNEKSEKFVEIRIIPMNADWYVKLACGQIQRH